ncbi:hypothetical protein GCM10022631_07730 [Deinococcus rubellus]|uniref:hypothetical protein n=1 Tax=Deinococcus rubellus TaxID=1889240 RepID=UPI0031EC101B
MTWGRMKALGGGLPRAQPDTLCIHGDDLNAPATVLEASNVERTSLTEPETA